MTRVTNTAKTAAVGVAAYPIPTLKVWARTVAAAALNGVWTTWKDQKVIVAAWMTRPPATTAPSSTTAATRASHEVNTTAPATPLLVSAR